MPDVVYLHPRDNICVAARSLDRGAKIAVGGHSVLLVEPLRQGHKIAITPIEAGEVVRKWGETIGYAARRIEPGEWVHSHNLMIGELHQEYEKATATPSDPEPLECYTFQGYRRAGGRAGTRNYIAVISSVNCSASVSHYIARRFSADVLRDYPNVDGVLAFSHGHGCGMEFGGEHHRILNRVMGGMARHPNIGGYLLVGLGCETATPGFLIEDQKLVQIGGGRDSQSGSSNGRPSVLVMQDLGGTQKTIEEGVRLVAELLPRVNDCRRETIPASEIVLGTNCGGSDGNSGITANAALGYASDLIVRCGGTTILGETTEIYGAEQLLTRRARTPAVADKLIERIKWWEWYSGVFGCTPDNNPSPGNKDGGLTTIYEKSLGAIIKGGTTALNEVYRYGEQVTAKGFVIMDTPGLDPVSVTGIVAGGANVVVFTTGRGSCFGFKPTPSIKVATNTPMYERMIDDMDINAGEILSHGRSVEEVGREIFEEILAVASGKRSKSEKLGLGEQEFQPWILGPTL
ncbi:MAG: altronate dehydratase family protein [Pirellulales bacterium]